MGAGALTGADSRTGAACVVEPGEDVRAFSASGCGCVVVLASPLAEAAGAAARGAGCGAIALGTLPAIGESPRNPPGIAARPENARKAADGSLCDVPAEPSRPIAKKQANTTTAARSTVGHCPFMLAPGPPMRTPSDS